MQLNKKTSSTLIGGIVIFMSWSSCLAAYLTPEEIAETVESQGATRFCGKRLNIAMKFLCKPSMRAMIELEEAHIPLKKSGKC